MDDEEKHAVCARGGQKSAVCWVDGEKRASLNRTSATARMSAREGRTSHTRFVCMLWSDLTAAAMILGAKQAGDADTSWRWTCHIRE